MDKPSLKEILSKINKKHGENVIGFLKDMKPLQMERISSGSTMLDYCLHGGFPCGRVVELYGPYSSGKGLISLFTIAEAQKKNMSCVWLDAENCFDPIFAKACGVDVDKLILTQISVGEDTLDLLSELLQGEPDIVVVDSVAAMIPKTDLNEPLEQPVMATRARLMSRALAKINALNKNTLIIFINQIRSSMTQYGPKYFTPGGFALGHYASIRVEVNKGELLRDKEKTFGQIVKFRVVKNKTGTPFRDGYFKFLYESGIDRVDEVTTLAFLLGKLEMSGSFLEFSGQKFHGREALETELRANEKLLTELKEMLGEGVK